MAGELRIRFLDVGQGDAIVGILPDSTRAFVVDIYKADPVLDFLESEGVTEVVLFLTHSDRDHTAGAADLLAELEADHNPTRILAIYFSRDRINASKSSQFNALCHLIGQAGKRLSRDDPLNPSGDFNTLLNQLSAFSKLFEPLNFRVLHPDKADQDCLVGINTNETAGVLLIEHAVRENLARRVLLTADVQLTGISLILNREKDHPVNADVLKFPHHGAWPTEWPGINEMGIELQRRSMQDFLNSVMPSVILFSVGNNNPHGHIRSEVINLLQEYHTQHQRLRFVRWTQLTEPCRQAGGLPANGPLAEAIEEGDIEIQIGDFPKYDFVAVRCYSST